MLSITDLKKDTIFQMDSVPYKVVEYNQKSMGRGGSIVSTKIKNMLDGSVKTVTFKGQDKVESADIERKKLQYLYKGANSGHFMDEATYEQFEIALDTVGDGMKYLKEGATAQAQLFEGRVINVELPVKVPLQVTEAPEVVRGDTQSTVLKTVTLENGTEIQTPIFIKSGDTIIVDTRDGSYVERKKD